MTKDDALAATTIALLNSATQLVVADRHRAPKDYARAPLDDDDADRYVRDAAVLWLAADRLIRKHGTP